MVWDTGLKKKSENESLFTNTQKPNPDSSKV